MFPTIAEYNKIIQTQGGNGFKTLSNLTFIPSRTIPVRIYSYGSGSYAVVFKAKDNNKEFAIRCFISAEKENIDRYRQIDNYLKNLNASWITKIELLEDEINVGSQNYPVIKMEWVEGHLLNSFISQIINDNSALTELQNEVIRVSKSLESLNIGHGDIQCGNIIIAKSAEGKNIIKLIDYDGMYIPSFSNKINLERGRTEFQHPNRSNIKYNEKIDRFSFWVILCAIEALKFDKTLWVEIMRGGFNTLDNLLFVGDDFKYYNNSKLVNRLYVLNKPSLTYYLNKLNKFCNALPDSIEPPSVFDTSDQIIENIFSQSLQKESISDEIEIISNSIGATILTSTFQLIGTTPFKIEKQNYLGKTLVISNGTQFKQVIIEQSTVVINIHFDENLILKKEIIIEGNPTPIKVQTMLAPVESAERNSGWIVFGISGLLIVFVAIILFYNDKNESLNFPSDDNTSSINSVPYLSNIDSVESPINSSYPPIIDSVESSIITPYPENIESDLVLIDSMEVRQDPASSSLPYNNIIYVSEAQKVVEYFFNALNNQNCKEAWYKTYNSAWESYGKDWFCSSSAFGAITKVSLKNMYTISEESHKAEIYVDYYSEDSYNGNKCYIQNIIVEKIKFGYGEYGWMITKMINIETPYSCY